MKTYTQFIEDYIVKNPGKPVSFAKLELLYNEYVQAHTPRVDPRILNALKLTRDILKTANLWQPGTPECNKIQSAIRIAGGV